MSTTHHATRDQILSTRTGSLGTYSVTSDRGAYYLTLGVVPGDDNRVYAIREGGAGHGLVVLVTRTGRVNVPGKGEQVRVRIDFPQDTGDSAGTLTFGNDHVGGVAPRVLFA